MTSGGLVLTVFAIGWHSAIAQLSASELSLERINYFLDNGQCDFIKKPISFTFEKRNVCHAEIKCTIGSDWVSSGLACLGSDVSGCPRTARQFREQQKSDKTTLEDAAFSVANAPEFIPDLKEECSYKFLEGVYIFLGEEGTKTRGDEWGNYCYASANCTTPEGKHWLRNFACAHLGERAKGKGVELICPSVSECFKTRLPDGNTKPSTPSTAGARRSKAPIEASTGISATQHRQDSAR